MVLFQFALGFNLDPTRQNGRRVLCGQNGIEFLVDGLNKMSTSWCAELNTRILPWEAHFFIVPLEKRRTPADSWMQRSNCQHEKQDSFDILINDRGVRPSVFPGGNEPQQHIHNGLVRSQKFSVSRFCLIQVLYQNFVK